MPGILVRPLQPDDAPALFAAVRTSLAELGPWLPWAHPDYAPGDAERWIAFTLDAHATQRDYPFGVFDADSGALIGGTGVNQIQPTHRIGNIGYWVATPWTGRGVAREAARQAAAFGFGRLGLTRLEIVALPDNLASQRVADALGARREGLARNRVRIGDRAHDAVVYSLVPEDLADGARR